MAMFIGLSGEVYDAETNQPATGATVLLCDSTGTVISKVVAGQTSMDIAKMKKRAAAEGQSDGQGNLVKLDGSYGFNIPRKEATYIIKATKGEKYDTAYALVSIKHLGKRERGRKVPRINIYRKARKLNEVTVTSKVKFFYRGDTLVYNADAFNLPRRIDARGPHKGCRSRNKQQWNNNPQRTSGGRIAAKRKAIFQSPHTTRARIAWQLHRRSVEILR